MDEAEAAGQAPDNPMGPTNTIIRAAVSHDTSTGNSPQSPGGKCSCGCARGSTPEGVGMVAPSYIYALGRVEPRFPSLAVEREFAQATGRAETTGLSDRAALHAVLTERPNRYLARQLCWVFTI